MEKKNSNGCIYIEATSIEKAVENKSAAIDSVHNKNLFVRRKKWLKRENYTEPSDKSDIDITPFLSLFLCEP